MRPLHFAGRFAAAALLCGALAACDESPAAPAGGGGRPPAKVVAETISPRSVAVLEEFAGRVEGLRTVEVRARVEGVLEARLYTEGAFVQEGAALFSIQPQTLKLSANRAAATLQRAQANLNKAEREWSRMRRLWESRTITARTRDEAQSEVELARADVAAARSELSQARIELGYTEIKAPISGLSSLEALPVGSLVQPDDRLTTITQLDPIQVMFALPADEAIARQYADAALAGRAAAGTVQARMVLPSGETYRRGGEVDFADTAVDPETGTVKARAVFANPDREIRPGQFVRIELQTAVLHGALVVPERAISLTQLGNVLYRVTGEGTAELVRVELGPEVAEGRVIASGLNPGDRVIVDGLVGLRDGAPVNASEPESAPTASAASAVAPRPQ